jgi:hypothetical protein
VSVSGTAGDFLAYRATWDGGPLALDGGEFVRIGDPAPLAVTGVRHAPGGSFEVTVEGLDPGSTYRFVRSPDLLAFPHVIVSGFAPTRATHTFPDPAPPAGEAFYRIEEE